MGQSKHDVDPMLYSEYVPAVHLLHIPPSILLNRPAVQLLHSTSFTLLLFPIGQLIQSVASLLFKEELAGMVPA